MKGRNKKEWIEMKPEIWIYNMDTACVEARFPDGKMIFYSLGNFVFAGNFQVKAKYTAILQLALSFGEDGSFLGSRANFIPCRLSEHHEINYYQPYPVTGTDAQRAIRQIQYDTRDPWRIRDYVEGVGAMQDFIPAVDHDQITGGTDE